MDVYMEEAQSAPAYREATRPKAFVVQAMADRTLADLEVDPFYPLLEVAVHNMGVHKVVIVDLHIRQDEEPQVNSADPERLTHLQKELV